MRDILRETLDLASLTNHVWNRWRAIPNECERGAEKVEWPPEERDVVLEYPRHPANYELDGYAGDEWSPFTCAAVPPGPGADPGVVGELSASTHVEPPTRRAPTVRIQVNHHDNPEHNDATPIPPGFPREQSPLPYAPSRDLLVIDAVNRAHNWTHPPPGRMQDPSYGVPAHLLPHVHLISDFRFPIAHQLPPEKIVEYLASAPQIVKNHQSVSWQYLQTPQDGIVLLAWQPQSQRNLQFASDGYMWMDPETRFQQDIAGCTVEIYAHRQGYAPRHESHTAHTRLRYRITGVNPQFPRQFDPSLWLVHYQPLAPQQRHPVAQLRPSPQQVKEMQERAMLESQGQLARRPFMLHDQANWPTVQFQPHGQRMPGGAMGFPGMRPGLPGQQPGAGQALVGQPPSKRMRTSTGQQPGVPGGMQPPSAMMQHDPFVEEEETVAMGDVLDHMTPRDISIVRYTQHHEWMEEVFASPYAAHHITPIDLGLGLTGELGELTRDILDAPDEKVVLAERENRVVHSSKGYTKLAAEKREEIEQRMKVYEKKQLEEIEQMKKDHAAVMSRLKKTKMYVKAERQLKDAKSADKENADPADGIVRHVESILGVKVGPRKDVVCVSKGGLIEKAPEPEPVAPTQPAAQSSANGTSPTQGPPANAVGAFNTTAGTASNTAAQDQTSVNTPGITGNLQQDSEFTLEGIDDNNGVGGGDDGMDLLDNMDIDIPDVGDNPEPGVDSIDAGGPDDWVVVNDDNSAPAAQALDQTATQPAASAPPTGAAPVAGEQLAEEPTTGGDGDLFGESTGFDDFTNLEDSAGDALADFGGDAGGDLGDLGMDESAFDDLGDGGDIGQGESAEVAAAEGMAQPTLETGVDGSPVTAGGAGEDMPVQSEAGSS